MLVLEIAAGVVLGGLVLSVLRSPKGRIELAKTLFVLIVLAIMAAAIGGIFWSLQYRAVVIVLMDATLLVCLVVAPPVLLQKFIQREHPVFVKIALGKESDIDGKHAALRIAALFALTFIHLCVILAGLYATGYLLTDSHIAPQFLVNWHLY